MSEAKAVGVRARVRAELTAEIKQAAKRQLAIDGAPGLSLRAIARELGMASSAIYRYFASREELLTALIVDAYNASAQLVEDADAERDRTDHVGRFVAMSRALRWWAIANPNEWALIYGSPVPGYIAPQDTIDPATRIPRALLTVLFDALPRDPSPDRSVETEASDATLDSALADLLAFTGGAAEPATVAAGVESWAELFGLISLELYGHFKNAVNDPEVFFDHAVQSMANRILNVDA
ncbi:MAG: TetR/AcrR family transcriptional regulator [Acidimicrobiales bacterium]